MEFLAKLQQSKSKSNRDVICLMCWKVLKYEQHLKHKATMPEHTGSILTSKEYAHEIKFVSVARALGKTKMINDKEYFLDPYAPQVVNEMLEAKQLADESAPATPEKKSSSASISGSDGKVQSEEGTLDMILEKGAPTITGIQN